MKIALVTGASRGIGEAIASQLRLDGLEVLTVARTEADYKIDLAEHEGPTQLMHKLAVDELEPDILINNLGDTLGVKDPHCSLQDWRRIFRINFEVALELTELCLPWMLKQSWGRVVNICSTASLENNGPVPYCSAKAALAAYTHSMGRVLAPSGVVMSGVLVGAVFTEGGFWDQAGEEHRERYLRERCPAGRFGKPEEIAHLVSFLASDRASFMQGALVPCDGGQSRHYFGEVTRD